MTKALDLGTSLLTFQAITKTSIQKKRETPTLHNAYEEIFFKVKCYFYTTKVNKHKENTF